jgi:outer membrane protein assembly factor BamB
MTSRNRAIAATVALGVLAAAGGVIAQDWPQWRGANRDGKVTGFTAPAAWPKQLTQKWQTKVGLGDASPALVGERLFVFARQGGDEVIMGLNAADGKELWQDKYPTPAPTGPDASHPGPRSSPAVVDGKVVTLGLNSILSCMDAASGKLLWRKEDLPRGGTAMSSIVVDGTVLVYVGDKEKVEIAALDLATGKEKWKTTGDPAGHASPVVLTVDGTKQIVTMNAQGVVGIAVADGKLLWSIPFPAKGASFNAATPIVDRQTVIYSGTGRATKAAKIEKRGDGFAAIDLWTNTELRTAFNTPVLKDGLLYGLSDRSNFFCLDAKTGKAAWTDTVKRERFGAMLDAGQVLLCLPSTSEFTVIRPSGKQYEEVARIKVAETPVYAHPIVAGKRIFVKDRELLTLWTLD